MSLLLAHGHVEAHRYPIGVVWEEASLVVERVNHAMASEAALLQLAVSSVLSKDAGKQFRKVIEGMTSNGK